MPMNRTHRVLIAIVVFGAVVIAAIGFAGSYSAVRELAEDKGFGTFAIFFPIGIDAGIVVLLALDLLLTWMRIPFPLLRQTAWLLTAATIAFNAAASWPDPLGVSMHAIIPVLFVVTVEAARHAIGRIADITADKHMEGVRMSRWLLAFPSTFRLWRRMKLWELRRYEDVIRLEQDRLVYRARLRARYGRAWRRKAPIEATMPLKLAKYGVPLAESGPAGLAAAGIAAPIAFQADKRTTSVVRPDRMSAEPDNALAAAGMASEAEADRAALSAMSAATSAHYDHGPRVVPADSEVLPPRSQEPQHSAAFTQELVRPGIRLHPLPASADGGLSGTDNHASAEEPDNPADEAAADKRTTDIPPLAAAADSRTPQPADKPQADNKLPRGALTNGVRAQLAVGNEDADAITSHLTKAYGMAIKRDDVARILRRERKGRDAGRSVPTGQYL